MVSSASASVSLRRPRSVIGILALSLLLIQSVSANLNPCALCGSPGKLPLPQNFQRELSSGMTCQEVYVTLFSVDANDDFCEEQRDMAQDPCCNEPAPPPPAPEEAFASLGDGDENNEAGSYDVCRICPGGRFPSLPLELITVRYDGTFTCSQLFYRGLDGKIPDFLCGVTSDFARDTCC